MVAAGKATVDGRPLLWKNRDTWQPQNEVVYFDGERYDFLAVVNAGAENSVWMGVNAAGFCIENSLSRDLTGKAESGMGNGRLMKRALETCATVADFERLLQQTDKSGRRTRANFGVIDARGGAAIFETSPASFTKFDANDPETAPDGVVVRANFATTASGEPTDGVYSAGRYRRACELSRRALADGKLDARYLLQRLARDVTDNRGWALLPVENGDDSLPASIDTTSTINRRTTVSAVVFQGVRHGEDPSLATMWVLLGQPIFSVAVPCWVHAGGVARQLDGPEVSPLCAAAIELRKLNYGASRRLGTAGLKMICDATLTAENRILAQTAARLAAWRQQPPDPDDVARWHHQMSQQAWQCLEDLKSSDELLAAVRLNQAQLGGATGRIHSDFRFDDARGTRLGDTADSAGQAQWDGGLTDCSVSGGRFRIRRNSPSAVNRYVDIDPDVRVSGNSGEQKKTPRGWLVMESSGWNLTGDDTGEQVRFGFTSRSEQNFQTAGFVIARTAPDKVTLSGQAFGEGGTPIASDVALPVRQSKPITFVIELDKVAGNNGEGDSGGVYRLYYRQGNKGDFTRVGPDGRVRRLRNGNQLHLHVEGLFGDGREFFDIDRLYFTTQNPISPAAG